MDTKALNPSCQRCGSAVLFVESQAPSLRQSQFDDIPAGVWRYRVLLPELDSDNIVTLGEGGTPLLRAERLGSELGLGNLLIKDESRNPTGSFMDRGSTVLLSLAKERRVNECTCVTTGNLGASLAAYCAKAGIRARIAVHPHTDRGKLYQMLAYGAKIEASLHGSRLRYHEGNAFEVTAANPYLLEGEKTTGFEILHELGWRAPDVIVVPIGTGGHLCMIWRSILQLRSAGLIDGSDCRLLGVQVGGTSPRSAAVTRTTQRGKRAPLAELEESEPFFRNEASRAISQSSGATLTTASVDTIGATGLLARTEGIFAEPSSSSVIAALPEAMRAGLISKSETVVCVITGAGLKDLKTVSRLAKETRRASLREPFALPLPQIGETKFALLRLLQQGPDYGYELRRRLSPYRDVSMASVYQHLNELEDFAMVRRRGPVMAKGRERILYELSRRGSDFLKIAGKLERADRSHPD